MARANLLVGQSGGCTPVINQTLSGIIDEAKRQKKIARAYGMRNGIVGLLRDECIELSALSEKKMQQLRRTPSSALGSCRHKLSDEECAIVLGMLAKKNIRYFLLIGGNDTALTTVRISEYARARGYELNAIAVPKTIDNDLPFMDHTPGYGSAATFVAATTQEAGKDTEAMRLVDPVKIIEFMGRNSGWLAAASALGKRSRQDAPHLVYCPERPFDIDGFLSDVEDVYSRIGYCVVVIAETIRDKKGDRIGKRTSGITRDSFGHPYLDSAAARLAELVESRLHIRSRYDKPGSLQRMSMGYGSAVDEREAFSVGKQAVRYALKGYSDVMVTLERRSKKPYRFGMGMVPARKIAGIEKYLPASYINKKGNFITTAFLDYARPLIGALPDFIRL
jgi:ATP-dependent phosphofructokinase / diphosphate-dependent phosphofructokinase